MGARYHPISDSLWSDAKLESATFECKGFFAYLCSNVRQRPSGIYRATDAQLAVDTELPIRRVRIYLSDLEKRQLVVRDGAWIFVRGYFSRQPKQNRLLDGVREDVSRCDSPQILEAFCRRYPQHRSLVHPDHRPDGRGDGHETVANPQNVIARQSSTEQYRAEQCSARSVEDLEEDAEVEQLLEEQQKLGRPISRTEAQSQVRRLRAAKREDAKRVTT